MSAATDTWAASSAFTRVIEALERHGSRVDGNGRQRKAQCPAHDDRNPSLAISDLSTGKVLIRCHAGEGCATEDVVAAVGLTLADLFDEPRSGGTQMRRRVVAEYRYVDEHGELHFVKERLEPKSFRVKRPDGHGGWAWGLAPDTPRLLYRLPQVLAAKSSDVVWCVEGEKDVHALEAAGEIATCNFDGASSAGEHPKWRADYSPVLAGRDVLVVADRDEDGRTHANYVARCLDGIARFVWIVEAAAGKDAADHLAAGHSITEFAWWS